MITTNREDYCNRIKLLRQHGMSVSDRARHTSSKIIFEDHLEVGYNYRMTDIQASVGIKQLEKLDSLVTERRKIAQRYNEAFGDIKEIRLPLEKDGCKSNYQSYSIYLKKNAKIKRNDLMQLLLDKGIATRRGIMCTHRETAYKSEYDNVKLPVSEDLQDNSILLPLYFPMTEEDISFVIKSVKEALA
jgi:dTDP-4-amino-4,6-dideoxygalactose transaminase